MKKMLLSLVLSIASLGSFAACTTTLNPGDDIASAVASAATGDVICLADGNYGTVNLFDIHRAGTATLRSRNAANAVINPQVGNTTNLMLRSLTIAGAVQNSCSRGITWLRNTFTQAVTVTNYGCTGSLSTTFDHNTFGAMGVATYEGRLSLIYGSGITVTGNTFGPGGASDGVFMGGNVSGVLLQGNTFTGIQEALCGPVHCDAVQGYGAGTGIEIADNLFEDGDTFIMMPDGSSGVSVHDNVFDGTYIAYIDKVQFGSANSPVFTHNTLLNVRTSFDSKTGSAASKNALAQNNLLDAGSSFKTSNGAGCSACTFDTNLFNVASNARGTNAIVGTPIYAGATLAAWPDYALAAGSPGAGGATDGTDLGAGIAAYAF